MDAIQASSTSRCLHQVHLVAKQPFCVSQVISDLQAAFVSGAVAQCREAADAVEGAHAALEASSNAQAKLLQETLAAHRRAVTKTLAAAQDTIAATIR